MPLSGLGQWLGHLSATAPRLTAGLSGIAVGISSNVANNLPVGLAAAAAATAGELGHLVRDCLLIGVDLGPNLSVTDSLATLLWLASLRRAGLSVTAAQFLGVGLRVMPPALILALLVRLCLPGVRPGPRRRRDRTTLGGDRPSREGLRGLRLEENESR